MRRLWLCHGAHSCLSAASNTEAKQAVRCSGFTLPVASHHRPRRPRLDLDESHFSDCLHPPPCTVGRVASHLCRRVHLARISWRTPRIGTPVTSRSRPRLAPRTQEPQAPQISPRSILQAIKTRWTQDPTVPAFRRHPLPWQLPLEPRTRPDLELEPLAGCMQANRRIDETTSPDKLFSAGDFAVHPRIYLHLEQEQASYRVLGAHATAARAHTPKPPTYTQPTQAPTSAPPLARFFGV